MWISRLARALQGRICHRLLTETRDIERTIRGIPERKLQRSWLGKEIMALVFVAESYVVGRMNCSSCVSIRCEVLQELRGPCQVPPVIRLLSFLAVRHMRQQDRSNRPKNGGRNLQCSKSIKTVIFIILPHRARIHMPDNERAISPTSSDNSRSSANQRIHPPEFTAFLIQHIFIFNAAKSYSFTSQSYNSYLHEKSQQRWPDHRIRRRTENGITMQRPRMASPNCRARSFTDSELTPTHSPTTH